VLEHQPGQTIHVALGVVLLVTLWLTVIFVGRVVPVLRHGRKVVLDRPKPCSMREAQHSLDRLVRAGFDAEIVEDADNGMNIWAKRTFAREVKLDERYVIQVPRKQARAANLV
jgi:hypothetical protein